MDNEELEKELTEILYKHTDQSGRNKIYEVDYEEVVKDVIKLYNLHFVTQRSELLTAIPKFMNSAFGIKIPTDAIYSYKRFRGL